MNCMTSKPTPDFPFYSRQMKKKPRMRHEALTAELSRYRSTGLLALSTGKYLPKGRSSFIFMVKIDPKRRRNYDLPKRPQLLQRTARKIPEDFDLRIMHADLINKL
jgi:hypothetical protein